MALKGRSYVDIYGFERAEEIKEKRRKARHKQIGPNTGKRLTEETKRKISEALKKRFEEGHVSSFCDGHKIRNTGRTRFKKGRKVSKEERKQIRERRVNQVFPVRDTSIEVAMQGELAGRGIVFEKHVPLLGRYQVDIKVDDLIIECDGNYWHGFPDGTEKDRRRDADLKEAGYNVLRFWGSEINEDVSHCVDVIEGVLG